jgi:hypothetical protein
MKSNILVISLIVSLLFIIPLTGAEIYLGDICGGCSILSPGECIDIPSACDNCSYTNITILYPNGTAIVENEAMTNLSSLYYYNYSFCDTKTTGTYTAIVNYDENGEWLYSDSSFFEVTYSGLYLTEGVAIIYVGIIFLLLLVILFCVYEAFIVKDIKWKVGFVSFVYLISLILTTTCWQLLLNFSGMEFLVVIFEILYYMLLICFLPFIFILSLYLIQKSILEQKVEEFVNMGYTKDEAYQRLKK